MFPIFPSAMRDTMYIHYENNEFHSPRTHVYEGDLLARGVALPAAFRCLSQPTLMSLTYFVSEGMTYRASGMGEGTLPHCPIRPLPPSSLRAQLPLQEASSTPP